MNALTDPVFKHYADLRGRASGKQFWPFALFYVVISVLVRLISASAGDSVGTLTLLLGLVLALLLILLTVPMLALGARCLHDGGRSGW